ncbi:MAG: hypothetical protein AAF361_07810 [Bacteroidota bacterium]
MKSNIKELKTICRDHNLISTEQLMSQGETVWYAGHPRKAESGFIALGSGSMATVIKEDDILEVVKKAELFYVKVKADTNLVVRFNEMVIQARPDPEESCSCKGHSSDDGENNASLLKIGPSSGIPTRPFPIPPEFGEPWPVLNCAILFKRECITVNVGPCGEPACVVVLIPYWSCTSPTA